MVLTWGRQSELSYLGKEPWKETSIMKKNQKYTTTKPSQQLDFYNGVLFLQLFYKLHYSFCKQKHRTQGVVWVQGFHMENTVRESAHGLQPSQPLRTVSCNAYFSAAGFWGT